MRISAMNDYTLDGVVGATDTYLAQLKRVQIPDSSKVQIRGVALCSALPSSTCTRPSSFTAAELRFSAIGELEACTGAGCSPTAGAASIFVGTSDCKHLARFVIYQATGFVKKYDGWTGSCP